MNSNLRKTLFVSAGLSGALLLVAQLQHLWWSTARVENHSGQTLDGVVAVVENGRETRRIELGRLEAGDVRFVRLPKMGEASFSLAFSALPATGNDCRIYVEGDMYNVRATVLPGPRTRCDYGRVLFTWKPILFEMLF